MKANELHELIEREKDYLNELPYTTQVERVSYIKDLNPKLLTDYCELNELKVTLEDSFNWLTTTIHVNMNSRIDLISKKVQINKSWKI
jgi:hypothetical protein